MIKKTNTLVADFHYVSPYDAAVDETVEDFKGRWQQYLDGLADPPLKPGVVPTTFVLKHLGAVEIEWVQDVGAKRGSQAAFLVACDLGLKAAKNWEDGKDYVFLREKADWIHPLSVLAPVELDKLSGELRADIGIRVLMAANPRPN